MTNIFRLTLHAIFSPRLYKIYGQDEVYQPQFLERWCDKLLITAKTLKNLSVYALPLVCWYIYRHGVPYTVGKIVQTKQLLIGLGSLTVLLLVLRAIGRVINPQYATFLRDITNLPTNDRTRSMEIIRKYDFEFHAWPVSFSVPESFRFSWLQQYKLKTSPSIDMPMYKKIFIVPLSYVIAHTFGIRLVYPGTFSIVQTMFWSNIVQGRTELVEGYNGLRTKIKSDYGNEIDTMFVDNRRRDEKGRTLVICCEGNSGFYEIGIMITPLRVGYSVLGWNHPGFLGSTGTSFPEQEHSSIEAVISYAMALGFALENIVIFGWSIGGYTAAWAGVHYPDIKGLILDATFDDIMPLALKTMPATWNVIVNEVIRSYINLNIGELIEQYPGKLALIRRTEDEIVCEGASNTVATNGANNIVLRLISSRHPEIRRELMHKIKNYVRLTEGARAERARKELGDAAREPLDLISRYLHDFNSTHCTPLSARIFEKVMNTIN